MIQLQLQLSLLTWCLLLVTARLCLAPLLWPFLRLQLSRRHLVDLLAWSWDLNLSNCHVGAVTDRLWRMWGVRSHPQVGHSVAAAASSAPGWPPCWWAVSPASGSSPTSVPSVEPWLERQNPVTLANTSLSSSSSVSWPLASLDLLSHQNYWFDINEWILLFEVYTSYKLYYLSTYILLSIFYILISTISYRIILHLIKKTKQYNIL